MINQTNMDKEIKLDQSNKSTLINHRQLLEKLYLLAELRLGKTLSVRSMTIIDHSRINSWYRWWYDEDRFKSIDVIYTIIDEVKCYINDLQDSSEEKKIILQALSRTRDGIVTLNETYKEDSVVKARVNTIITEIESILRQHQSAIIVIWPLFTPTVKSLRNISSSPNKETKSVTSID